MTKKNLTNDLKQAIEIVLTTLSEVYPGKFIMTESLVLLYLQLLEEFDPESVKAATLHLLATRVSAWPPSPAELREACVNLELGRLNAPTAYEAWLEAWPYICGHKKNAKEIPSLTQRALLCAGGIEKLGQSSNLEREQRTFIRAYETLQESARQRRLTLPTVSRLVDQRRARLLQPHPSETTAAPATKDPTHG